ncbi:unnamed protein product [Larinioides sclopetarius]|uniref:acid phosphatase n=1 Tax=Larinioides sclopetarius TaxID=280406 RepID=A0AAV2B542_9ARAC
MVWLIRLVYGSFILHTAYSLEDSKLQLVQTLGKKQQYALGKVLRSMYQDFITTNPSEVLVNSSATDRCLTSAAATMASFYAPEGRWKFEDDLNWQPIPIHYVPPYQDKFLSFKGKCPRVTAEMINQRNSEELQELFQKYQAQLEIVSNYTGLNVSQGVNAFYLHDTLLIEKMHNLTIPEWVDLFWEEIHEIADSIFQSFTSSPLALRLRVGPLLQDIDRNMRKKISGDLPDLKVQMHSAHDINIAAVLLALNFTNMPRPPYCATLLFELHEMSDATWAVRLLYLNSTDPLAGMGEPQVLELDDCSEFCPVENFTNQIQHLIPENWEQECQLHTSNTRGIQENSVLFRIMNNTSIRSHNLSRQD